MNTLSHYVELFLTAKSSRAEKTLKNYELITRLLIESNNDAWPLKAEHVEKFLADCKARGLSDVTINTYWRSVKALCNWLHRRGHLIPNPILIAERPRSPRWLPRVPKEKDLKKLFNHLRARVEEPPLPGKKYLTWCARRDYALCSLLLDAGLRCGEAAALELVDLDLQARRVVLRATKTANDGTSYFSEEVGDILAGWLAVREALPLPIGEEHVFISAPIGTKPEYAGLTVYGINQIFQRRCTAANIKPWISPHQLRHACALYSLANFAGVSDIQKQLRHKTPTMTLRYLMFHDHGLSERQARFSAAAGILQQ